MITLTLKEQPPVPLEAEVLSPDTMAALSHDAIRALPVYLGKQQCRVDDFFTVDGEASDEIEIRGDAKKVKWIGRGDDSRPHQHRRQRRHAPGRPHERRQPSRCPATRPIGSAARCRAGSSGSTEIPAGRRGGVPRKPLRHDGRDNSRSEAAAGLEVGMRMKRGTIVVGGMARDFAGLEMKGGTIILLSGAELRTGAWMMRGTIVSLKPLPLLPSFLYAATYNPTFLRLYARYLETLGVRIPYDEKDGAYHRHLGDSAIPGRGEILLWQPAAA